MTAGAPNGGGAPAREHRAAAREWIRERRDGTPSRLSRAVDRIVAGIAPSEEDGGPWDVMARGALRQLEAVRPDAGDRDAALELLAADALLTYAFHCAAEEGGDLEAMAERWGPRGRLGDALARARRETGEER